MRKDMELISTKIKNKKLFLLDIDGTISFDSTLFDGSMDFLQQVNANGGKYVFITNNSTKSIADYITKFEKWEIPVDETSFLTASYATALYLKENYGEDLLFVLGTTSFIKELRSFGLNVTEELEDGIKAAVVGFDNELNYEKLTKICELLQTREVDYLATNPDLVCPVGFGFVPDCGAICGMIETAVKRKPRYIGKPNPVIVEMAMKNNGYNPEDVLVIGDRLYTDIACGINAGVDTAVVFTGEAQMEDLKDTEFVPTYYSDNIREMYECIK